jgi:hypothetical protein
MAASRAAKRLPVGPRIRGVSGVAGEGDGGIGTRHYSRALLMIAGFFK